MRGQAVERGEVTLNAAERLLKSTKKGEVPKKVSRAANAQSSSAIKIVKLAIKQLRSISLNDPKRTEAFEQLRTWLEQNDLSKD